MHDREIDSLYFTAQVAHKLNFHHHSIQILDTIIEKKPQLPIEILDFYIQVYLAQLNEFANSLSLTNSKLDNADSNTKMFQIKVLQQLCSQCQSKMNKFHDQFIEKVQNQLLPSNNEMVSQFLLLKSIGDSYNIIGKYLTGEIQKRKSAIAKDSYEKAFALTKTQIDHKDPTYLKFILNWTSFQFTYIKIKETPSKTLFQAYREGVSLLDKVDPKQRQEYLRVLDAMKRNMAIVSVDEEKKTSKNS